MEATSIDALVAHCNGAHFTGILRIRAHEGIGEVWFLSGITDEVHFGVSTADEAMGRMRNATQATFELVAQLPHPAGGFKRRFPAKGSLATATPVTLMRYCEQYALTCTLAIESKGVLVEATYELGELVKVETTADDDGITTMLESQEGAYELMLPRVELPAGTPVLPPAPSLLDLMPPESLRLRAVLDAKPAAGRPPSNEAEVKRKTIEVAHRQKKSVTTPAAPPASSTQPVAETREAKAAVKPIAPPKSDGQEAKEREAEKREAEKREAEKREVEKREAEKREAEKREAEQLQAEKRNAEQREVEERDAERIAPKEPVSAEPTQPSGSSELRSEVPPPPAGSWSWIVVPLLLLAALGYLFWTHRF